MKVLILFIMLFLHLVDDYYLQGILAQMKQKKWWEEHTSNDLYKNDYMIALLEHAFSWAFMIMLPAMVFIFYNESFYNAKYYVVFFILNWLIHAFVDNMKANKLKINLIEDQAIHIGQIMITWFFLFIICL